MKSLRCLIAVCLSLGQAAVRADDSSAQRQRLAAERATIEARFRADEAACRERFVVTPCVDEAKAARREALARLRQQELVLDDADRRQRALNRQRDIADKRALSAAQAVSAAAATADASAPLPARAPMAAPAAAQAEPAASRPALDGGADAVARRAEKSVQRQDQARERQQRIEQREREHQKKGQKSAPLPASASRP